MVASDYTETVRRSALAYLQCISLILARYQMAIALCAVAAIGVLALAGREHGRTHPINGH